MVVESRCRSCAGDVIEVLDLGRQPVADRFPLPSEGPNVSLHPLRLVRCGTCALVQLPGDGPDEGDDPAGPAPTSSSTMDLHARAFAAELVAGGRGRPRRILEMASHGGHLSPFFREIGIVSTVLEESDVRARGLRRAGGHAVVGGIETIDASSLGSFDLVVDNYLLAHLKRPAAALANMASLVSPGGRLVIEFDHLLPTILGRQFDAVRHGHRSYLTLGWIERILGPNGMRVVRAQPQPVYGGALRVTAERGSPLGSDDVESVLDAERAAELDRAGAYTQFGIDVQRSMVVVREHLQSARDAGRAVVGYGAPARAVTFLNAFGIGPDLLPFTVDRAVVKQGREVPGTGIPIHSPKHLATATGADVLILPWDLAAEIRTSLPRIEATGGRFIVAVPRLALVTAAGVQPMRFEP